MPNLVTQSLKILNGAVKEVGKDYFANLTSFYNDAKNVKNTMLNASTDVADTYAKIKKTNVTKTISDWFYQTETDSDMDMNTGDDFDAGFEISSSKDSKKLDGDADTPKALTADAMTNITGKQTNTMLKIGRRQTEQSVANTAEIISTIDTRTSEMLTSLNNINKTLLGISSRLDKLIEFQTFSVEEKKEIDKGGLYQDGNLSLGRIFEASKQNVLNSGPMSYLTMGLDYFKTGALTPTALASIGLKGLAGKIKVNGKSFDDWGNAFNEMVGTATQTAMNEMINSSVFKKIVGDITSFEQDKDYGKIVPNHYDNKRTYLDGMMKVSIVDVIPQMLAKINQSISGQEYHLDGRGKWIAGPMKNEFNEVTRASFANTGINSTSTMNRISNAGVQSIGKKIPDADIEMAAKALTMAIVMDQHSKGQRAFTISQLKGDISGYVSNAVQVLVMTDNANANYWANVCQCIAIQLSSGLMDASGFVRNINDSLQRMITEATNFAQSGKANATQAGKLSFNMAANQFLAEYGSQSIKNATNAKNNSGTLLDGNIKVDPTNKLGKYSLNQYIGGIFQLLNRGINVKIDGKGRYSELKLEDVRPDATAFVTDDTFGEAIKDALTGGGNMKSAVKNAVKESMLGSDDGKEEGFLKKILSNPAMLLNSATNLVSGGKFDASGLKEKAVGLVGEERYDRFTGKIKDTATDIRDSIRGSERYQTAKLAAEEAFDKIKGKGGELLDKAGHTRIGNNIMYARDSLRLKSAEKEVENYEIQDASDQTAAALVKYYTQSGMFDDAAATAAKIKDQKLKTALLKVINLRNKRAVGNIEYAHGETPDIGSVMITRNPEKVTKNDNTRSILGKILHVVGKIGKAVAKLATSGIRDIYYGIKSIGQGMFGYKDYDPKTGKVVKNKGIFREVIASMFSISRDIVKGIGTGITKVFKSITSKDGDDRSLSEKWSDYIDKKSGKKITEMEDLYKPNKTWNWLNSTAVESFSRKTVGGTDPTKMQDLYQQPTAGKSVLVREQDMTWADALKHPIEAVTKSLDNFGQNLEYVGKTIVDGTKEALEEVGGFINDLKKKVSSGWDKFKDSKFGNLLTNNSFTRGFMSGFKDAKAAKERAEAKAKAAEDRAEHPLQAEIVDSLSSPEDAGKKKSIFHSIYDKLFGAKDSLMSLVKKQTDIAEEASEKNSNRTTRTSGSSTMPDINSRGSTSTMPDIGDIGSETTITPENGRAGGGGLSSLGHISNVLGSIGKMFGGFLQMFGGLFKLIVSIVTSLEGFQALTDLVKSILTEGLKPLNDIFKSIIKVIKPIVKSITKIVKTIAKTIATIAESVIETISPIIEAIQPLFDALFTILEPILKVITTILDVVLMPIKILLDKCAPLFEAMAYEMQIVSGVLEVICGYMLQGMGNMIQGLGYIMAGIQKFTGGDSGEQIEKVGANMSAGADEMIAQGKQDVMEGIRGKLGKILEFFTGKVYDPQAKSVVDEAYGVPAKLGNDFGAGDAYTNNVTNNYYGNGNPMDQHSYGKYMNMSDRGCGPIALADAYGRRSGSSINPGALAGIMAGAGAYDPSRGTSVNSMLAIGNAMGMGMRAGGVTAASIKQATPDRPITLLGSGSGYGTHSGHNHYVNVIGTDKSGGAYIANPMTGKIERQNAGSLVSNAKLGLYGSGDDDDYSDYGFSEEANNSIARLKAISSKFTSIFQGEDEAASDSKNKTAISYMQNSLGEEKYNGVLETVKNKLMELYPQEINESSEDYAKRIANKLSTPEGRKLIVKLGKSLMDDYVSGRISGTESAIDSMTNAMASARSSLSESVKAMIAANNMSADAFTGATMASFEPILHLTPDLTKGSGGKYYASPVHDFFNATSVEGNTATRSNGAKGIVYSSAQGGWFKKYGGPQNAEGEGSSGQAHEGVLLKYANTGKNSGNAIARAITGGTVTYVTKGDDNGGLGNSVKWRDEGGMYHWYIHLASIDRDIQEGANLAPGQIIGYFGRSGLEEYDSQGNKLPNVMRYVVTSAGPQGSTGDPGYINPFTYWQFREEVDPLSGDKEEQTFKYLVSKGMSPIGAAGMMGCFKHESNFQYDNLENVYQTMMGYPAGEAGDAQYAADVDSKKESRERFISGRNLTAYAGQTPGAAVGFGIAQFTSQDLKSSLYDNTVGQGKSITDIPGQLDEVLNVLQARGIYDTIKNANSPTDANKTFLWKYEAGTGYTSDEQVLANYPWMLQSNPNGVIARHQSAEEYYKKYKDLNVAPGTATAAADGTYKGKFISTTTNPDAFGSSDILKSAAEVFSAWNGGDYSQADMGTLKLANGTQIPHFRPDCSGSISGVIKNMGYDINVGDASGFRTYDLTGLTSNTVIYKNGQPSNDWQVLTYNQGMLQPGDIIVAPEHMGMYITGSDNSSWGNKGYDGGATGRDNNTGLYASANAGKAYLAGKDDWQSLLAPTISGADTGDDKILRVLRFVGTPSESTGKYTDRGGLSFVTRTNSDTQPATDAATAAGQAIAGMFSNISKDNSNSVKTTTTTAIQPKTTPGSNGGGGHTRGSSSSNTSNKSSLLAAGPLGLLGLFGSGDSDIITSTDVPPLDLGKLTDVSQYTGLTGLNQFINKYNVKTDDQATTDMLNKLGSMTFNVRAKRVEELLEILIAKVDGGSPSDAPLPNLFNEGIPEPVSRLSMG